MFSKVYNVSVFFDLLSVNCPGVWLCPKGTVFIKVTMFGVSDVTKEVGPTFPLVFNERFTFHKAFKQLASLGNLHRELETSRISMELLQFPAAKNDPIRLAIFSSTLADILYTPLTGYKSKETSADLDLLFCPCSIFPGIIAPKAEVSTKLAIVETTEKVSADGKHSMIPATVSSRSCTMRKKTDAKIIRQHPVCHTKNNVYCKCLNGPRVSSSMKLFSGGDSKKSEKSRRLIKSGGSSPMSKKRCDDCSSCSSIFPFESRSLEKSPSQKGSVREYIVAHHYATRTNKVPVVSGPELDSICDCQLCKRYELYFRERTDDGRRSCCKCACNQPSSESALSNPKMARSRSGDHECHSPVSIGSISSSDDDVVFYCHCHRSLGKGRTASGYTIDEGDSDPTSKGGQDECRRFMKFQEQEREKKAKPDKKKQPSRRGHATLLVEKNSKLGK